MNVLEHQIRLCQDAITWHEERGMSCSHLHEELEHLLKVKG